MGLETPQGWEIFTKGIVAVSLVLSVPSAAHEVGTKLSDLLRCVSTMLLVLLSWQRASTDVLEPLAMGGLAPYTTAYLKAWIPFSSVAQMWYGKGRQRFSDFPCLFIFFFFFLSFPERKLCLH